MNKEHAATTKDRRFYGYKVLIISLITIPITFFSISEKFLKLIEKGEFTQAQKLMRLELAENPRLTDLERLEISWEIERLEQTKPEFNKNRDEVVKYIKNYMPDIKRIRNSFFCCAG